MKRRMYGLMILLALVMSLAACGGAGTAATEPETETAVTEETESAVPAETEAAAETEAEPEAVAASVVLVLSTETPKDSGAPVTVPAALPPISVIDWPQGSVFLAANVRPFKLVTESTLKLYFVFS